MYKTVILGKELVISNKAYEALVRKWRVGNIRNNFNWIISGICDYCFKFNGYGKICKGCPFEKHSGKHGCQSLLKKIARNNYPKHFYRHGAAWTTKEQAIACVSAVEEELRKFKKVK
jgi:hypothetical protein